jgi:hypothetical protein
MFHRVRAIAASTMRGRANRALPDHAASGDQRHSVANASFTPEDKSDLIAATFRTANRPSQRIRSTASAHAGTNTFHR